MRILWFTWKDRENPLAGGAEVVNEELASRLAADGHEVKFVVGGFPGANSENEIDGYKIIRVGSRWTVYWQAWRYYRNHLNGWADVVIDEVNTMPFFAKLYVREPNILFVHMLCRRIWFYQLKLPFSLIGYLLEPLYLWLLRDRKVITVSDSTKNDLVRHGFNESRIFVISEGIEITPVPSLAKVKKYPQPTLLSLGSIRPMKQTLSQLKAFELAKRSSPELKLIVAGDSTGWYGRKTLNAIANSPYSDDIKYVGRVSQNQKAELMRRCYALLVTSIKEGWGLVVTEANSQGTPAIVYDVDGLRDSVRNHQTGLVAAKNTPVGLADAVTELLKDRHKYDALREEAWKLSQFITFDRSYKDFKRIIKE